MGHGWGQISRINMFFKFGDDVQWKRRVDEKKDEQEYKLQDEEVETKRKRKETN